MAWNVGFGTISLLTNNNESNILSCPHSSIPHPIEAGFASTSTTPPSSAVKKRALNSQGKERHPKRRRKLPASNPNVPNYPCEGVMKFDGRIFYSKTPSEVEDAARDLLQILGARKRVTNQVTVGFDMEWRPTFQKGVLPRKVAVMQLCVDSSYCHVMHIFHSGITQSLQFLLGDPTLLKVGVGIRDDCIKVLKDYNVCVRGVEDLSNLANQKKLGGVAKTWGLRSLTTMLVGKEIWKPNKITLSNWEVDVLSKKQLDYAATDAFASWHLHQVLMSLPQQGPDEEAGKKSKKLKLAPL